ncbi:MAG: hypothetical protein EOP19_23580 [Hyphomicrobiales bacterium]|nr:MAG: hypothetical protein EOP19_23580 [Hyphomicrobiales bacterium]
MDGARGAGVEPAVDEGGDAGAGRGVKGVCGARLGVAGCTGGGGAGMGVVGVVAGAARVG